MRIIGQKLFNLGGRVSAMRKEQREGMITAPERLRVDFDRRGL
jgi:hypothetical protein